MQTILTVALVLISGLLGGTTTGLLLWAWWTTRTRPPRGRHARLNDTRPWPTDEDHQP